MITPAITGAVGDVYMNLDMSDKAANQFLKAAKDANDNLLSPIYYKKAGLAYYMLKILIKQSHFRNYQKLT